MKATLGLVVLGLASVSVPSQAADDATCSNFTGSTMLVGGQPSTADWRMDYDNSVSAEAETPWEVFDFKQEPRAYMQAVLSTASDHFERDERRFKGVGDEPWWIVPWLDYTSYGREPMMGLTKERQANPGDFSPHSTAGHQVWAVGFYNAIGAKTLREIFNDPCNPDYPDVVSFEQGTASVKFLFTDAPVSEVEYLKGGPVYSALIDPKGTSGSTSERVQREVRLLQVDIAVKDSRAAPVGWVYGTFAWIGLTRGDQLFDNLVPVSLQWGDDKGVYDESIEESWINPLLKTVLYGWSERPTLGFQGRANGPADSISSSCLSCHAAARFPNNKGKVPWRDEFHMVVDLANKKRVREYVDDWFVNLPSGALFNKVDEPIGKALDYSMQLDVAAVRMCQACLAGDLNGKTPDVCVGVQYTSKDNRDLLLSESMCPAKSSEANLYNTLSPQEYPQKSLLSNSRLQGDFVPNERSQLQNEQPPRQ